MASGRFPFLESKLPKNPFFLKQFAFQKGSFAGFIFKGLNFFISSSSLFSLIIT